MTNYEYNNKNQLTSITSGDKSINYAYNSQNLLNEITQGNKTYKIEYDNFLNKKKISIGNNITLSSNEYEQNNGNLISTTYGNNQTITFDYDDFKRVKTINKMDDSYHFKYDKNNNIKKLLSNSHKIKCSYDIAKRINKYRCDNFTINYDYDSNNNVTNRKYKLDDENHTIENIYDKEDLLAKSLIDNSEFNYQYDSLGRIINKNIGNSYNIDFEYVSNGKRTSNLVKSIKNNEDKYSYKYDKLNNITHIYYNDVLMKQYYYDIYNELIKEEDLETNERIEYTYDNSGNLLTKTTTNITTGVTIDIDTYEYTNTSWEDQLTKFNDQQITYDNIGNPLTIGNNITLTWINGRSLNSYTDTSKNLSINYKYNQDGIRTSKIVNGLETKYHLERKDIIYEQRGDTVIYYIYDSTGIIGLEYNGNVYYYVKNLQGDIIGILDFNYNKIVTYEYDSWGRILNIKDIEGNSIIDSTNIGLINPFRYRGYYYDQEIELYYLNSRYYNPKLGRFINADNEETITKITMTFTDKSMYSYCDNNAIARKDTGGQFWETVFDVLSFGASIVEVCINPTDPLAWAGLVGDTVDLVPFVTGVGETARAIKTTVKVINKNDDVVEVANKLYKTSDVSSDIRKSIGSYEITYKSGKNYIGKGDFKRAIVSARQHETILDSVTGIKWKSSINSREAFIDEYLMQKRAGSLNNINKEQRTYNKIWSPGKKYYGD